jgi:hypothetical protein
MASLEISRNEYGANPDRRRRDLGTFALLEAAKRIQQENALARLATRAKKLGHWVVERVTSEGLPAAVGKTLPRYEAIPDTEIFGEFTVPTATSR